MSDTTTTATPDENTMVAVGSAVRAIESDAGTMRVGGYLVPFTDENNKDLYDTFWTDDSYLGARAGDGSDAFVHHTFPLDPTRPELVDLAERRLTPLTTRVDKGVGLWAETVLDLSDEYESAIAEMVRQGRLSWSSATAAHLLRVEPNGWVRSWPIIEGSLTPTPGTPFGRTKITTLRTLIDAAIPKAPEGDASEGGTASDATRGAELGPSIEESVALAGYGRLSEALWNRVYLALYPWENTDATIAERIDALRPAFDEFRDTCLAMMHAMLDGKDSDGLRAAVHMEAMRAGAVLSAKNYALVEAIAEAATALLSAATKEKDAERSAPDDVATDDAPDATPDAPKRFRIRLT